MLEHPRALDLSEPSSSQFAEPKHGQDAKGTAFEEPSRESPTRMPPRPKPMRLRRMRPRRRPPPRSRKLRKSRSMPSRPISSRGNTPMRRRPGLMDLKQRARTRRKRPIRAVKRRRKPSQGTSATISRMRRRPGPVLPPPRRNRARPGVTIVGRRSHPGVPECAPLPPASSAV